MHLKRPGFDRTPEVSQSRFIAPPTENQIVPITGEVGTEYTLFPGDLFAQALADMLDDRNRSGSTDPLLYTSMTADFNPRNPITQALLKYGSEGDVVAPANYGHHYGNRHRWTPIGRLTTGGRSSFQSPFLHMWHRNKFIKNFPGDYVRLYDGRNPSSVSEDFFMSKTPADGLELQSHLKSLELGGYVALGTLGWDAYSLHKSIEAMVGFNCPEYADFLWWLVNKRGGIRNELSRTTGRTEPSPGEKITVDAKTNILIDYGVPDASPIRESWVEDLDREDAEEIFFSTCYVPEGEVAQAIGRQTLRGTNVEIHANRATKYLNGPGSFFRNRNAHSNLTIVPHLRAAHKARGKFAWTDNTAARNGNKTNHLKLLVVKYGDGGRVAHFGSYGGTSLSVHHGTSESEIRTTDGPVIEALEHFARSNLCALPSEM